MAPRIAGFTAKYKEIVASNYHGLKVPSVTLGAKKDDPTSCVKKILAHDNEFRRQLAFHAVTIALNAFEDGLADSAVAAISRMLAGDGIDPAIAQRWQDFLSSSD